MVKVSFECNSIADLKLEVQEYSLIHLGLNLKDMAMQRPIGPPSPLPNPAPPQNEGRVLHNPKYPGPMPNAAELMKRRPGRPTGWRKNKKPEPTEALPADVPVSPTASAPVAEVGSGLASKEFVKAAIHDLNRVKGFAVAKSALEKFGAKHLNEVNPEQYEDLIKYCEELINGQDGAVNGEPVPQP